MNPPYDLNQDGKDDVSFVAAASPNPQKGIVYFVINGSQHYLTEQSSGNVIAQNNLKRVFDESFMYLRPIPIEQITLNPNLKQNEKWESK
jgi:starch-binding outer membrane protein, SusD/RagB family